MKSFNWFGLLRLIGGLIIHRSDSISEETSIIFSMILII